MLLALSGGLGNILFQCNLFHSGREVITGLSIESDLIRRLRRLRGIHSPSPLRILDIIGQTNHLSQSHDLYDSAMLFISRIQSKPVAGYNWCEDFSIARTQQLKLLRSYGQFNVPISVGFLDHLRSVLISNKSSLASIANNYDAVVHIRGGDYHSACRLSQRYYKEALASFEHILICTNDKSYAASVLPGHVRFVYSSDLGLDEIADFSTMALASHLVASNSTFSWWAGEIGMQNSIIEPSSYNLGPFFSPVSLKDRIKI